MSAANITGTGSTATTSVSDLYGAVAANTESIVAVRVCNKTSTRAYYRLYVTDNANAVIMERHYDFPIDGGDSVDVEIALTLNAGNKLRHQASVGSALAASVSGTIRSTL